MVSNVTMGRNGLYDWAVQRATALILLAYVLCIGGSVLSAGEMDYAEWQAIFDGTWMRIFSLLALLALCAHAWIGMWTVATDYLTPRYFGGAATLVRFLFELLCLIVLFAYLVWGVMILWSV